ncbi:hypothetical protein [Xenorhabdus szentirmaii]|uniref:hypothetical protein n=1 Tax=Xenorhabdus szentirmaii TaxID=290112 RepID=UPI002B415085|nr:MULTISPECIES: hypothetical protein [unclassified Xenorhabdus]
MKNIIIDMQLVFVAILLAMFTQTLTSGIMIYHMWDSFIAMSLVVFLALVTKHYLPSSLPHIRLRYNYWHCHLPARHYDKNVFSSCHW